MGKAIFIVVLLILAVQISSAAKFISGNVYDAPDGTAADGRVVIAYNPFVGIRDNVTDIVGVNGNAGIDNKYLLDCEALRKPCEFGDLVYVQVLPAKDKYASTIMNGTINGASFIMIPDLYLQRFKKKIKLLL